MSDHEALRAMAENRGCKLVKGRGRVPGRRDYGKYGLKDSTTGHEVFGFGNRGVTASLGEIEQFLRDADAGSWEASLKASKARLRRR